MGVRERNIRLGLQWQGLHTVPARGKISKILEQLHNIKKFTMKNPRKVMEKLAGSLQHT